MNRVFAFVTGVAIALGACANLACNGGDDDPAEAPTTTATVGATSMRTIAVPSRTPTTPAYSGRAPLPPGYTPAGATPVHVPTTPAGQPIAFSPGTELLDSDLIARGYGTGGRGAFNIERMIIRDAGVDAPVASAVVGLDGRMPDPPSLDVAVWYDFSNWPHLGGLPDAGGNVVVACNAYKAGGAGICASLRMSVGSFVRLALTTGTSACYRIEFVKLAKPAQFELLVSATAEESLTLITGGTGEDRAALWGRRTDCADEPPAPPVPTAQAGHHKLKIVAENLTFTIVEGGTVPLGTHTVDYQVDHRDAGVEHTIAFYDTTGRELIGSEPVVGPIEAWFGTFGVGPPQPPGQYTFRCSIHPQMTGAITVLP